MTLTSCKVCPNCQSRNVRLKWIERGSDAAEAGKFVLAIFTIGFSTLSKSLDLNRTWGNKFICRDCDFTDWTEKSWRWNESP